MGKWLKYIEMMIHHWIYYKWYKCSFLSQWKVSKLSRWWPCEAWWPLETQSPTGLRIWQPQGPKILPPASPKSLVFDQLNPIISSFWPHGDGLFDVIWGWDYVRHTNHSLPDLPSASQPQRKIGSSKWWKYLLFKLLYLFFSSTLSLSLYISLYISLYLSLYLSIYLSISIYLYLSLSISIYLYLSLSIYLSIYTQLVLFPPLKVADALSEFLGLRGNTTADGMQNRRDKQVQQDAVKAAGMRAVRSVCGGPSKWTVLGDPEVAL